MSGGCEAIVGEFAWFSTTCREPVVEHVTDDEGVRRGVCAEHAATLVARP